MITYATITTDNKIELHEVEKLDLDIIQKAVGGYFQAINIKYRIPEQIEKGDWDKPSDLPHIAMYLNEDGKYQGLPYNTLADLLVWRNLIPGDHIVGNVILVGLPDSHGNETSLPKEWVEFLEKVK